MKLKQITPIFLLTLTAICVNAQTVKGRVADKKNGEAVPFANVMIMTDTSANARLLTGAVTDMDGRFSLQGKPDG
ncbi:MAG: carboxypeptidase-like regulatory domain-containing protein, partial [Bacteroidales bacterium]|nr:carboxypeptidase-like regulatory domain-containing protein [Bacteroidales bacterium]